MRIEDIARVNVYETSLVSNCSTAKSTKRGSELRFKKFKKIILTASESVTAGFVIQGKSTLGTVNFKRLAALERKAML